MTLKIERLKITLQVLFTSAQSSITHKALCSQIDDKRLVDQLQHLLDNIGTHVSDDEFVDAQSLEIVRDSLTDVCAVLAHTGRNPNLHRQIGSLIREVNMVRTLMHDPGMAWWNDYLKSFMGEDKPVAKRLSEIQPITANH